MARTAFGNLAAWLLCVASFAGCHLCAADCEVTKVCRPEVKTEKVVKKGWDVECKQICIPPVNCPLFGCCGARCGRVIAVKKLKPDQLECGERCVVEYKLVDACPKCEDSTENQSAAPVPTPKPQ